MQKMESRSGGSSSCSSGSRKRQQPFLEAALRAEQEEVHRLEEGQEQEAGAAQRHALHDAHHALVHYESQGRAADGRKLKDVWSDALTFLLLDLLTRHYIPKRNKEQWSALTNSINDRIDNPSLHKTASQVQSKIGSLRKRYRRECMHSSSNWPFFQQFRDLVAISEGNHVQDNGDSRDKKRKKIIDAGPHDRFGPNVYTTILKESIQRAQTKSNHNNEHTNYGNPRTWGDPWGTHEARDFNGAWSPRPSSHATPSIDNPWLALANSFDKFSKLYKHVEMQKINAYTELVTKLLDRRN